MLHSKFQGHRFIGSVEEVFLRFLPYVYEHGGHVGHVTQLIYRYFRFHSLSSFYMNFGFKSHNCFSENKF